MNPYAYQSLAALIINILLAVYILSKNPRGATARIYVLLLVAFILWDIPEFILRGFPPDDPSQLLALTRLEWTGISFIPGLMSHFVLAYPRKSSFLDYPWSLLIIYTPSVVFTSFLWAGNLLVESVVTGPMGYSAKVGALYMPLGSLYALIIILALSHLGRAYAQAGDTRTRTRSGLMLLGFAVPVLAGIVSEVYGPYLFQTGTRVGLGTAYTTAFTAIVAYTVFRYRFLVIEPATEVVTVGRAFRWEKGRNYLVLEKGRRASFGAFRELVQDVPGLCVTAFPPQILSDEFTLQRTPILWLSSQEAYQWTLKPSYLEVEVLQTILRFMRENQGSAILLDDLEYLCQVNGFRSTMRSVSQMTGAASKNGCTLIMSLSPSSVEPQQEAALRSLFDDVQSHPDEVSPKASLVPPGSILWERGREECFRAISRATLTPKILVSTLLPEKLQAAYELYDASFLWVNPSSHPRFPSHDPSRLPFEVLRDVSKALPKDSLVYVGELEILIEQAGFLPVLEYVKHLMDVAALRSGLVVASVGRGSIAPSQLAILEKRFASVVA